MFRRRENRKSDMPLDKKIKYICKNFLIERYNNNIENITSDDVRNLTNEICSQHNITDKLDVQNNILYFIVKHLPSLTNMLEILNKLEPAINDTLMATSTAAKELRCSHKYNLINAMCWPNTNKISSNKEFILTLERLIEMCGCDVRAVNVKKETPYDSYLAAISRNKIPDIPEVREILHGNIRKTNLEKYIVSILNKLSNNNIDKLSNLFKIVCMLDLQLMVEKLLKSSFSLYSYSKKAGCYEWVTNNINICKKMLDNPIRDDEWKTTLETKFKNPEIIFENLVMKLVELSISQLEPKKKYLLEKNGSDDHASIAIDVIGSIVSDVSLILKKPTIYVDFINTLFLDILLEVNQNLLLTSIAHILSGLTLNSQQHLLTKYINSDIINKLVDLAKDEKKPLKYSFILNLESYIRKFTGETIKCENFTKLITFYKIEE